MTSSWFSCVSFGYCDIFLQSSSRALQGNGGLCSARFPSWIFLFRQRGPNTLADCSSRTDRSRPPRKRPIFQYLSPFGHGEQHLLADSFLQRVNIWCHAVFIYMQSCDHGCSTSFCFWGERTDIPEFVNLEGTPPFWTFVFKGSAREVVQDESTFSPRHLHSANSFARHVWDNLNMLYIDISGFQL